MSDEPTGASTLVELLQRQAERFEKKEAFRFVRGDDPEGTGITFRALHDRARAIGSALSRLAPPGERALMLFPPGIDFIAALFGCFYAGLVAVPVAPPARHRPASPVQAILDACAPSLILTNASQLETASRSLAYGGPWIATDRLESDPGPGWTPAPVEGSRTAMLQYTSGSTSAPRGVVLSHANLLHNAALIRRAFGNTPERSAVFWLPLYHDMGLIGGVLQPLFCGGSCTLMAPAAFLQRPALWLETISRLRATVSGGPDYAYDLCVRRVPEAQRRALDLSCWEIAFTGSEPIRAGTLDRFVQAFEPCGFRRQAFFPCYGLAEATLLVSGGPRGVVPTVLRTDAVALARHRVQTAAATDRGEARWRDVVACGEGLPGQTIRIVDPRTCRPCDEDSIGEIWVQGPSVASGYHDSPDASARTFGGRLEPSGDGPFMRTGDLGFVRAGQLFVTGRQKDLIIIRGRNLYPEDLEHALDGVHDALRIGHCAAFPVEVDDRDRLVVVHEVEPRRRAVDGPAATLAIRQAIAAKHGLEVHAVVLVKAGQIPKTSSGKTRRSACRDRYLAGELEVVAEWKARPREAGSAVDEPASAGARDVTQDEVEGWLKRHIASRLGLEPGQVRAETPFVDFGMGSVDAVETIGELEEWLGRSLSPTAVYDHPSIASLARWLAGPRPAPHEPTRAVPELDAGKLFDEVRTMTEDEMLSFIRQEMARDRGDG